MDAKKPDRRTIKTRRALCAGLAELLATKELHRITVQEIADKADVNRVTFYKHYLDVYDLYDKLENEVITELGLLVLEHETDANYMQHIIDYIDGNRVIFTMVFSPYSTGTLRDKIDKMIGGTYLMIFRERFAEAASGRSASGASSASPKALASGASASSSVSGRSAGAAGRENFEFACHYHAMGCLAVIEKWVRGAYAQPKDLITKTISELDANFEAYLAAHFR